MWHYTNNSNAAFSGNNNILKISGFHETEQEIKKLLTFDSVKMFEVMIYHFSITSPESRNFHLAVEIDGEHSFYDFHTLIQKSIGFESHQLASFFIPDHNGNRLKEISLLNTGFYGGAYLIMQKTCLTDVIELNLQQLFYTYDFISDRSLNIELTGIVMERNLNEPMVLLKQGEAPVQVYEEDSFIPESAKFQEEEVLMDFGILDDYNELYGEMEDF